MKCASDGDLRAYLDSELAPLAVARLRGHVEQCPRCQKRLSVVQETALLTSTRMHALAPRGDARVEGALVSWRNRLSDDMSGGFSVRRSFMDKWTLGRVWRPVLVGAVIVVLLVGVFSFAPSRALARQLLSVFRVRRVAVVQLNTDLAHLEELGQSLENKMFLGEPEVVADEPVQSAASGAEASQLAGFDVRLPAGVFVEGQASFEVKGRSEVVFAVTRDNLAVLFDLAGMDAGQLPPDWAGGEVRVQVPATVSVNQGEYHMIQVLDPTIMYPEGIDARLMAEVGLRLLGIPPADARQLSGRFDWTSTLVLPIPTDIGEFREVAVAGSQGVLLGPEQDEGGGPGHPLLLWEKGGIVYLLSGPQSYDGLMDMAETMF